VNSDGVKAGFNSIRSNIQINETINVEVDPTNNAPIAVFDGMRFYHNSVLYFLFFYFRM